MLRHGREKFTRTESELTALTLAAGRPHTVRHTISLSKYNPGEGEGDVGVVRLLELDSFRLYVRFEMSPTPAPTAAPYTHPH